LLDEDLRVAEIDYEYSIHKVSEEDFEKHHIGDHYLDGIVIDGVHHDIPTPDGRIGFMQPLLITRKEL
jgi:hypothetical protein